MCNVMEHKTEIPILYYIQTSALVHIACIMVYSTLAWLACTNV